MTNEITTTEKQQVDTKDQRDAAIIKTSLNGDWTNVSEAIKIRFVQVLCQELKIPLALNPFRFLKTKGVTKLYTGAEAASLIGAYNNASVKIVSRAYDKDSMIYSVVAECSTTYKVVQDEAHLFVGKLTGEDRANAFMKCVTKAKRRAILSAFGLSARDYDEREPLEETEIVKEQPVIDENQEARIELFNYLTSETGLFPGNAQKASEFILSKSEKSINTMDSEECYELLAQIDAECKEAAAINENEDQESLFVETEYPSPENNKGL